jgi:hypothetical protein
MPIIFHLYASDTVFALVNKINKVQWVDFKLENVLVSLHSLKTMGLGPFGASAPLFLRNGELLGQSIKLFAPCGTLKLDINCKF